MYREYCYAQINEEGWASVVQCSTQEGNLTGDRVVPIELTEERNHDWYMMRYYDFESGEWGEKHESLESEEPWDEDLAEFKKQHLVGLFATAELGDLIVQHKIQNDKALAELGVSMLQMIMGSEK